MTIFQLKLLAAAFMLIDHIGMYFDGTPILLRLIGRLAFPLFLFCMTQGYRYTRSRKKYLLRLYAMNLVMVSIMYLCGADYGYHDIFITLFWVGIFISIVELFQRDIRLGCAAFGAIAVSQPVFHLLIHSIPALNSLSGDILYGIFPNPLHCEFGIAYVVLGVAMYFFWQDPARFCASFLLLALIEFCNSDPQCLIALALPLLLRYHGEKGPGLKYFFYLFYPAHTLLLFWLSVHF